MVQRRLLAHVHVPCAGRRNLHDEQFRHAEILDREGADIAGPFDMEITERDNIRPHRKDVSRLPVCAMIAEHSHA